MAARVVVAVAADAASNSIWLHGDGSYAAIVNTVTSGVLEPKESSSPMPPMGGRPLTPAQVRAVAAYVYSLTHPEVRRGPRSERER